MQIGCELISGCTAILCHIARKHNLESWLPSDERSDRFKAISHDLKKREFLLKEPCLSEDLVLPIMETCMNISETETFIPSVADLLFLVSDYVFKPTEICKASVRALRRSLPKTFPEHETRAEVPNQKGGSAVASFQDLVNSTFLIQFA